MAGSDFRFHRSDLLKRDVNVLLPVLEINPQRLFGRGADLADKLAVVLGAPVKLSPGGPDICRRIGIVSNEHWQAHRMLPLVSELISADFPGTQVLPVDTFPQGNTLIGTEETAALVKESGVDAVIIGNAA